MNKDLEKKSYAPPITPGDAYYILQGTSFHIQSPSRYSSKGHAVRGLQHRSQRNSRLIRPQV